MAFAKSAILPKIHSACAHSSLDFFAAFAMAVLRLDESNVKTECPFPLFDIYFRDIFVCRLLSDCDMGSAQRSKVFPVIVCV